MDYKPTILTGGEKRSDDQIMAAHEKKTVKRVSGPGLPGTKGAGEPLVVMELLQRLRVKDVMRSRDIASVVRTDSLRYAENLMKRYRINMRHVVPHYHWTRKNCPAPLMTNGRPGPKWSWFLSRIDYYYRCINNGRSNR